MRLTAIALVVAFSVGTAVTQSSSSVGAAQTQQKKLAVDATFSPNPPTAKGTEKIIVSVRDTFGRPVSDATVKISTSMPTMSMKGSEFVARDGGHGTYTADAKLGYPTRWAFDITAASKGRSGSAHLERDLK